MNEKQEQSDSRVNKRVFPLRIFVLTFIVLGLFTTGQMFILQKYVDYTNLPASYTIAVFVYWLFVAAGFVFFVRYQIEKRYQKPMEEFAVATHKVAKGDFSVYVPSRHLNEKMDYLDIIFSDFNIMIEELGSIETLKTDFFSNVSHEIKTPLAVIQNYAEALKKDTITATQKEEYLNIITESSAKLASLITNILKLNKLEKQVVQPTTETYDLCEQICDSILSYEKLWSEKGIEFITDIEERVSFKADASLLEVVWNNLISNAIKFTESKGTIIVTQTSNINEVCVSITDNGCGMNEETLKHIFDKFYQGDTSHATEGNGLGLALTLRIIQIIGGTIAVTSTVGLGSTFTVRIPVFHK